jgi:ABC-type lipoprotein export system ATPase subunit
MTLLKKEVQSGITVIMVTHDLNILEYADEIVQFFDGRILTILNVQKEGVEA